MTIPQQQQQRPRCLGTIFVSLVNFKAIDIHTYIQEQERLSVHTHFERRVDIGRRRRVE